MNPFPLPSAYCLEVDSESIVHKIDELIKLCDRRFYYLNDKSEFYELTEDEWFESEELRRLVEFLVPFHLPCMDSMTAAKTKESLPRLNKQLLDMGFTPLSEKTIAMPLINQPSS